MRIQNCLSAVSDLREVGPFKSPVSHCISAFLLCWFLSSEKKCPALFQKVPVPPPRFFPPSLDLQICFAWQNWQETEEINEKPQHGDGIWWRPSLEKVISRGSDAVSHSRKSSSVQRLLSHSVQPALALCKYNKVLSTQTHRLQWKTLSSPSPTPPPPPPNPDSLLFLCLPPSLSDPAAHLALEQRNKWSASAEGRLHRESDCR